MNFKEIVQSIFSIKNIGLHKQVSILGIKFKFKTQKLLINQMREYFDTKFWEIDEKIEYTRSTVLAVKYNEHLKKYFGKYRSKDLVVIGCGHSLEDFIPIDGAIYIGINRAFKCNKVKFDYIFASDQFPEGMDELKKYDPNEEFCKKIITYIPYSFNHKMHNNDLYDIKHERIIYNSSLNVGMPWDISCEPFATYWRSSTTFNALQFALYTLPRRIYLVGFDCTKGSMYREKPTPVNPSDGYEYQKYGWGRFKEDTTAHYPEVEIISINPIGLKGMFRDVYTKKFVDKCPELSNEKIQILEEELCLHQ